MKRLQKRPNKYCLFFVATLVYISLYPASAFAIESTINITVSLKECVAEALAKNPIISYAIADFEEKQQAYEAVKKDRLPFFSAQYAYTKQPDTSTSEKYFNYAISLEQPIYKGKAITTAIAMGGLNVEYAKSAYKKAKNDLVYKVYQSYYDYLRARKLEDIANQSLNQLQSHLKDANAYFEAGLIPKNDLLISELQVAQGRQDLLKAQNNVLLAQSSLNLLMKKNVDSPLFIQEVLNFVPRQTSWNELVALAYESRAEISQADVSVALAQQNISMARAVYLPTVALTATYMKQGDHPLAESYPYGSSEVKTVTAAARWRFWTWGQNHNKEEEAKRGVSKALESRDTLYDSILLELRLAYLNMQLAEKNIEVAKKTIDQAIENYRISEARYLAQFSTSTEVLDAQTLLSKAQTNYNNALYDYNLAWAAIDKATGVLADN